MDALFAKLCLPVFNKGNINIELTIQPNSNISLSGVHGPMNVYNGREYAFLNFEDLG